MHRLLRRAGRRACCVLVVALTPLSAGAQQRPGPVVVALNTVVDFRANWVGDSTRLDACSVERALGSAVDFHAAGMLPEAQALLDRVSDPCAEDSSRAPVRRPMNSVRVDSIVVSGDSVARVHVTVRKQSEQRYFETYDVGGLNRGAPVGWIREVRVWGIMREYPVRPGGPQPPRP